MAHLLGPAVVAALAVALCLYAFAVRRLLLSPASAAFAAYLIGWNALAVFTCLALEFHGLLPRGYGRIGFLLFVGIVQIPVEGITAWLYLDFAEKWFGRPLFARLKWAALVPFAVVLGLYVAEALAKLSLSPLPRVQVVFAPVSGWILKGIVGAAALSGLSGVGRFSHLQARRAVRFYAVATPGILAACWVLVRVWVSGWSFSAYYVLELAVNIPGLVMVRLASPWVSPTTTIPETPVDPGWLGERFGVTPRELEVVMLAIAGRSNLEIAEHLHVSLQTVKKHIYNVYKKVGVRSRLQLLRMVERRGP